MTAKLVRRQLNQIPTLWYENKEGDRFFTEDYQPPPRCFKTLVQRTRFIELRDTGYGKDGKLFQGASSYSTSLFLALTRPTFRERIVSLYRILRWIKPIEARQAQLMAAISCEGCMNVLAWEYGLSWGYKRGSEEHKKVRTSCELCDPVKYYMIVEE